jgi:hypothetical protein
MFLIGFPLLLIPFALYNIFAFIFGVTDWMTPFLSLQIISGALWQIAPGDLLVAFAIFILFIEILKSTRLGTRTLIDHMLSVIIFLVMTVEFLLVPSAATSTFFLLIVIAFVEVLAGFTVSVRPGQRAIGLDDADKAVSS